MLLPIEEIIAEISDSDKPLLNSKLIKLSNMSRGELRLFEQAWTKIEFKWHRQIIHRLVELAEENFELNFDGVFTSCLKDKDAEVRTTAIGGLWENEDASLIIPLIDLLEQDSSEKVQAAAATALGRFAMMGELNKLHPSTLARLEQALLAAIDDKTKLMEVRRRILEAVAPFTLPKVTEAIAEAYRSQDTGLMVSALYAMGKNCDRRWLPTLLKELENANAEVRYEAARACGELEDGEAVPHLIKLINDPDIEVQLAAIQALGKIGGTQAKRCLKQCLNSQNEVIRQTAEEALSESEIMEDPLFFSDLKQGER